MKVNKISTSDDMLDFLETLGSVSVFRIQKTIVLFNLAGYVDAKLSIVELGAYHGWGTITLACGSLVGSRAKVISVDDYINRTGSYGEIYGAMGELEFHKNIKKAGVARQVKLLKMSVDEAFGEVKGNIGLLVWDLDGDKTRGNFPMYKDFMKWKDKLVDGGMILLIDTPSKEYGSSLVKDFIAENSQEYEIDWNDNGFIVVSKHT